jgi:hypothetical protein
VLGKLIQKLQVLETLSGQPTRMLSVMEEALAEIETYCSTIYRDLPRALE